MMPCLSGYRLRCRKHQNKSNLRVIFFLSRSLWWSSRFTLWPPVLPGWCGLCPGKWRFPLTASLFSDCFKPRNHFFFFFLFSFAVQLRREADHRATPEHKRRKLTSYPPLIAFTVLEKFKKIPLKKSTVKLMT